MKNKGGYKVFGVMEGIYSRTQQLGEGRRLGKCERISGRVWRKDEHRSKETGETRYGRRKGL